jgi:hypothetical protein
MWLGVVVLALFVIALSAGVTGIGTYDSRDARFSVRSSGRDGEQPAYTNLLVPQHRRRRLTEIFAEVLPARMR